MSKQPPLTHLSLPQTYGQAKQSLTSIPWPADRTDFPAIAGGDYQVVPLFDPPASARLRRYLLLTAGTALPGGLEISASTSTPASSGEFSNVTIKILRENLDRFANPYVYRECEARVSVAGREIGLRMGLLPNSVRDAEPKEDAYSWWQWSRAERIWSGPVAEAWRIGGHLIPYSVTATGKWSNPDLTTLGDLLNQFCGDILHGDVYLIVWKTGLLQATFHYKSAYFHTFPKEVPAFPVVCFTDLQSSDRLDFTSARLMFNDSSPPRQRKFEDGGVVIQPWQDLRFLANKTRDDQLIYLPPEKPDVFPAGISRTFWCNLGLKGVSTQVARYQVSPGWYRQSGVIESDQAGPAAALASRNARMIREETQKGGIDTGRVWRYLRRWQRLNKPQEDGAEWEGNLAQGVFQLAYQTGESPEENWEIYLHHAYHAADVSVYHGAWMGRLECTAAFTAPLPKFRFGGLLYAYLETGDPYLLELTRSVAGVYMAMEWALQPRSAIGRDAYPITCMMTLYDYSGDKMYLDFARQAVIRLLQTQEPDGGFAAQAGAGVLTGVSCRPALKSIHFGSGILAPFAILEWAIRDNRWPVDFVPRLRKWADLMLELQRPDGHWYVEGKSDEPYTLTGSGTVFTLIKAGQILKDPACIDSVRRYLKAMNGKQNVVLGTHSFLSCIYAHVADAALSD